MVVRHVQGACMWIIRKFLSQLSSFFCENVIFWWLAFKEVWGKTQKQKKIKQNLFGNFYSTLNSPSNGVQYVELSTF